MIIFMSDILCVTSRLLCQEDFLTRLERIADAGCAGIILREKDLSPEKYRLLAEQVLPICRSRHVPCILHNDPRTAEALGTDALHLPLPVLRTLSPSRKASFRILGSSCHSLDEALEAESLGCTYITAGHIFSTECKKGLKPRGVEFLREICRNVAIPVWAIGGITPSVFSLVTEAGARGGCVMSGLMSCEDPGTLLEAFRRSQMKYSAGLK